MPKIDEALPQRNNHHKRIRIPLLIAALALLFYQVANLEGLEIFGEDDFVEYWAAARLNLNAGNPYDPAELFPLQLAVYAQREEPLMMWNPPWTLSILLPLGLLEYSPARIAWLLINLTFILISADMSWQIFGGSLNQRWIAWLLGITFMPALFVLKYGQIGVFVLFGLICFLAFERRGNLYLAGACTILIAIKPHILHLFWPVLLLWLLQQRKWRMAVGAFSTLAIASLIPLLTNPQVYAQYFAITSSDPPLYWATPTLGALIRLLFDPDLAWLQFIPMVLAWGWLLLHWSRNYRTWSWTSQLPLITLVSVVTAPFGWAVDLVVLVPVLIQSGLWIIHSDQQARRIPILMSYLAVAGLAFVINLYELENFWYWWLPSSLLGIYLITSKMVKKPNVPIHFYIRS